MSELVAKSHLTVALHTSTMRLGLMIGSTFFALFMAMILVLVW